ncbi:c-type cytochrome [Sulfurospirillum halorespirans]|uniref:Cytochrome c553 n=1 Tax=Sulfurospirillum halorespirans DSM 13726 TaxID=1193502 RepID=A0A1D7TG18_9BACT|nr:c-type cytochrome [Sulfurospirillum halorespirans]AOO63968.1 cytochrome c553 [Sulfurospirillum halorespirans DSM 13726]
MARNIKNSLLTILLLSSFLYAQNNGESLFKQCAGCHGADGRNKAFGKSGIIAGQSAVELMESLKFYKESEFKTHSTTLVMSKQVKNMNMEDLNEIANYVSKLQK